MDKLELGPKLEHVTKSRPRPVGRRRPSRRPVQVDEVDGRGTQPSPLLSKTTVSNGDTKKAAAESAAVSPAKKEETDGRNSPKGGKSPKKQAAQSPSASKHKK